MNFLENIKNIFTGKPDVIRNGVKLVSIDSNNCLYYEGSYYNSDIVRACIRPFYRAVGKLNPHQIKRNSNGEITGKTDLYISELLKNPNSLMTMQCLLEKVAISLQLNSNAFIYIVRNDYGLATALFPINAYSVEKEYSKNGDLFLKFNLKNNETVHLSYFDIIHIRKDFSDDDDIFGQSPINSLKDLMQVIKSSDNAVVNAVKNGGVLRWLLTFAQTLKPEDLKKRAKAFEEDYLKSTDGLSSIVASQDNTTKVEQLKPTDYVPNSNFQEKAKDRIYSLFGTNENIIQSKYTEDEWQAYFENEIEPVAKQLSDEFSRKIFRDFEKIGDKNQIIFDSTSLQFASLSSKLNLLQMVDRGAMTPNEWRKALNLPPIANGDEPIRRLDTAVVREE